MVPGVPRYHEANCILIRFMADDDVQKMAVHEAAEAGCTPCRACQPDEAYRLIRHGDYQLRLTDGLRLRDWRTHIGHIGHETWSSRNAKFTSIQCHRTYGSEIWRRMLLE